jgi:hypothetical protein
MRMAILPTSDQVFRLFGITPVFGPDETIRTARAVSRSVHLGFEARIEEGGRGHWL